VALSEFGDADRSLYVRQLDQNRSFGPIRPDRTGDEITLDEVERIAI
jgi:hypothetical protein